jgi:hypothetical protein
MADARKARARPPVTFSGPHKKRVHAERRQEVWGGPLPSNNRYPVLLTSLRRAHYVRKESPVKVTPGRAQRNML